MLFERDDWRLFVDPATLPQKAGCQPSSLRQIVLREIVDNALDAGADATIECDGEAWIISDNGPGLDPADVPRLFAVNRPLLSSKRRRLPLRGMLGNGLRVVMGAVAASEGSIIIETRSHRLKLATDTATGTTQVVTDEAITPTPGLSVSITLGEALSRHNWQDDLLARTALNVATYGKNYNGPSSPWWNHRTICICSCSRYHRPILQLGDCAPNLDSSSTMTAQHAVWTEATLKRCYIGCDS